MEEGLNTGTELLSAAVATGMLEALASEASGGRLLKAQLDAEMGLAATAYMTGLGVVRAPRTCLGHGTPIPDINRRAPHSDVSNRWI